MYIRIKINLLEEQEYYYMLMNRSDDGIMAKNII